MHDFRGADKTCVHLNADGSRCQLTYLEHIEEPIEFLSGGRRIDYVPIMCEGKGTCAIGIADKDCNKCMKILEHESTPEPKPQKNEWWRVNYWWFDITSWLCDKGIRKCKTCRENDQ